MAYFMNKRRKSLLPHIMMSTLSVLCGTVLYGYSWYISDYFQYEIGESVIGNLFSQSLQKSTVLEPPNVGLILLAVTVVSAIAASIMFVLTAYSNADKTKNLLPIILHALVMPCLATFLWYMITFNILIENLVCAGAIAGAVSGIFLAPYTHQASNNKIFTAFSVPFMAGVGVCSMWLADLAFVNLSHIVGFALPIPTEMVLLGYMSLALPTCIIGSSILAGIMRCVINKPNTAVEYYN